MRELFITFHVLRFTHHVSRFTNGMTFLPLIERELRLRARSPAAYWTRFIVALGGALICLPQLLSSSGSFSTPATIGRGVFNGIVSAAFLLICGVCLLTAALNFLGGAMIPFRKAVT